MKIVITSINPLFPEYITGGASKHLKRVSQHLGELGHEVVILAARIEGSTEPFYWQENVRIEPVLRFHQPFPQPYDVPGYIISDMMQHLAHHLVTADRCYIHDGEFLFPDVYRHFDIPTIVSLRDNIYPETQIGSFIGKWDALILISEYSRRFYTSTVGRFYPGFAERVHVIPNGIDWSRFSYTLPDEIFNIIPRNKVKDRLVVLHPHRPEPSKGLPETIQVVNKLVHQHGLKNVSALVPKWMSVEDTPELLEFYSALQANVDALGLTDHIFFHDWIPYDLMPQYYSLGQVTLSLGWFPEAFGNSVYESLGCGTPSIAARITTHRDLLPDDLLHKVDYGDVETAARYAADILKNGLRTSPETLAYLQEHYGVKNQLEAYTEVLLNAKRLSDLIFEYNPLTVQTRFQLAPWCALTGRGIYNDFNADYFQDAALLAIIKQFSEGFAFSDVETSVGWNTIMNWFNDGLIAPLT